MQKIYKRKSGSLLGRFFVWKFINQISENINHFHRFINQLGRFINHLGKLIDYIKPTLGTSLIKVE